MNSIPTADDAAADPCARLAQLQHTANEVLIDPDELLTELRLHVNAIELTPTLAGANLRRECVCELYRLLDRYVTLGGRSPADWLRAFQRAAREPSA